LDIQEHEGATVPGDPTGPDSPPSAHKDRYTGLCIFGVMEILAGAMVAMHVVSSAWFFMTSKNIPTLPEGKVPTVLLVNFHIHLAALAIVLVVLGIGTMRARRWAWALNLILSWFAVLMSAWLAAMSWFIAPQDKHSAVDLSAPFLFILCVIVSLVFHLFYRDKDVELTCRQRDPVERWTDRRPLPIIAASLVALRAADSLLMNLVPSSSPPYGPFLVGVSASALLLFEAGAQIYAAAAMFKGRVSGWWVALVADIARAAFSVLQVVRSPDSVWTSLIMPAAYLIFLLWLRRCFPFKGSVGNTGASQPLDVTSPGPTMQ
jgi:hypothetical protein